MLLGCAELAHKVLRFIQMGQVSVKFRERLWDRVLESAVTEQAVLP